VVHQCLRPANKREEVPERSEGQKQSMYNVYILECADKSFYVGCTNNLERRLIQHNDSKWGAHYTKIRRPVILKYSESFPTLKEARKREAEIKGWRREKKLNLIQFGPPKVWASTRRVENETDTINFMIEDIYPEDWQEARGTYSPAKKIDLGSTYLIYVSGQQVDKNEKNEAITDDIEDQTELVFQALERTLKAADASIDDVVKAQIFLTDINDFPKVSVIRDKWFAKSKPVSTLVEVNAMTRKGAKIEIEVTAFTKK
jgi:enamine deaminase RidA (YjgF/YER057c/UK114 family)